MFSDGMSQLNTDDFTIFNNNSYCGGSFDFSGFDYLDPSNIAGPSQAYTGVDVLGDFNSYPDYSDPSITPTSLVDKLYPQDGKWYCTSR